jgi:hypothetical protein
MESLQITGTNTADDVTVELQANPDVVVNLLAGNDRSFVASRGTSTTNGGDGNDNISAVTLLPYGTAGGAATEVSSLNGGSGNDTLTDLGWDDGNPKTTNDTVAGDVSDIGMRLDGGPGADVLHGSPVRPELVTADPYDTLDLYGPADVTLQGTPGPDTIAVDLNGNYGPKGNVTTPDGVARPFALPTNTARLTIDGGAGADAITVGHRSSHTDVMVANSAGGDRVTLRPSVASFLVDRTQRTLSQGSPWHDMSWGDQVNPTITLLARP